MASATGRAQGVRIKSSTAIVIDSGTEVSAVFPELLQKIRLSMSNFGNKLEDLRI